MALLINIHSSLSNISVGAASGWDIFLIIIFLIIACVYGLFMGRNRMIVLLLSSCFSLVILQAIPWEKLSQIGVLKLAEKPASSVIILIFLGLILLFYFLIPRSVLTSALRIRKRGEASWYQLFLLAVLQIGLMLSVIFSQLNEETIDQTMGLVKIIFTGPATQFIWVTAPILTLVLLKKKKKLEDSK